jgi:membrane protease YdiL (CAAX protease family)
MLSKLVEILFVFLLVVGVPLLSYLTARREDIHLLPRSALYFSSLLSQWFLAATGAGVASISFNTLGATGFKTISATDFLAWTALLTIVCLAVMGTLLFLELRGWWPSESELLHALLPETRLEKVWCVAGLAPTAAFCEEFLYRGYLLAQLSLWLHSLAWGWAISSLAFGLAHSYQGLTGMARAAMLGALLAYPLVHLGSLYPSMAAHFAVDAIGLVWLGPRFLRRNRNS